MPETETIHIMEINVQLIFQHYDKIYISYVYQTQHAIEYLDINTKIKAEHRS